MTLDEYGTWTEKMWFVNGSLDFGEKDLTVCSLGLAGETGEVMEILKKRVRDDFFDKPHLIKELGDVIYYWARLCKAFDVLPSEVLAQNVLKVEDRKARDVMSGSGDDR